MKRLFASLTLVALALCAALTFTAVSPVSHGQGKSLIHRKARAVPGQYIVVLKDWAAQPYGDNSFAQSIADDVARQHGGQVQSVFKHALLRFSVRLPEQAAEALTRDPRVEYVEEDGIVTASATQTNPP